MPIFDNELVDNVRGDGSFETPDPILGSHAGTKLNLAGPVFQPSSHRGFSLEDLKNIKGTPAPTGFGQTFSSASEAELIANQRYPVYERGVDLENIYGLQQPWYQQLGYGVAKGVGKLVGTFAQSLTNIPNTISAFKSGSVEERMARLSGDPEGYEGTIDNWMNNLDNVLPNYFTRYERDHPFSTAIPFTRGSANWWGEKFISNLGFMGGAVIGAAVQDAAVGFVTDGLGELPLVASQLGKASLYLNRLFSAESKVGRLLGATEMTSLGRVTQLATDLGKSEQQILNMRKLAELSAAAKMGTGFRYGMAIYGSALTEAGVESRDSYTRIKKDLTDQYVRDYGKEPDFTDAQAIEDVATGAMNTRFGINMALLTASNTLQFGNLFRSMTAAKNTVQQTIGEAGKIGLAEGSLDVFEKKTAKTIAGKVWETVKPAGGNIFREGVFEEGGQYAAERGTYDYYTRKYKNSKYKGTWNELNEVIKSTTFGMKEQFGSTEGIENMLIGGLTGLIVGKFQNIYENRKGVGDDARIASALATVNRFGLTNTLQRQYDSATTQAGIAKDMGDAAKSGDVFKYKNLQEDAFFDFVSYRLPSGMHDVTIMQLEMLKDLPKDQFEQMFQLDFNETNKATVNDYVDALIDKANGIKKTSDAINDVFTNPFKNAPKEGDIESQIEADNHQTFENYKLDLGYYASIAPNVNRRLGSIQQDLNEIAPGVTTDLIAQLTNADEIKALGDLYEEKANQLNSTVTEFTSVKDKIDIKNQVKALRTRSEKIARALGEGKVAPIFKDLINFELNGQDATKEDVVSAVQIDKLINYGIDTNKLLERKKTASIAYDKLATREGFEKYFEQEEEVTADRTKAAQEAEEEPTAPTAATEEKKPATYINKAGVEEPVEVNREYQLPKAKVASVKKLADDRWEVSYPGGTTSFYKTKEDADLAAADINDELGNLQKVKVLGVNDDGSIKVENLKGDIFNIQRSRIQGYEKVESKEEKFSKAAGDINRQQDELEKKNGGINVGDTSTATSTKTEGEGKLKSESEFFISGTSESEETNDPSQSAPHIIRSRVFLNNAKNFKNRQKLAAILVAPNQLAGLGLSGLAQLAWGKPVDSDLADVPNINNVDLGLVAQVFVEVDGNKVYFVDEKGERIGEVNGSPVDINKVVFQNMPTTEIYYNYKDKNGNPVPRFREGKKEVFQAYANSWKKQREILFKSPAFPLKPYKFNISRGVGRTNKINGQYERNGVGGVIIPENKITNQQGLIVINTEGKIVHQGKVITWPIGNPAIQYGDTLEYINNTKLGSGRATTIYQVFKALSEDVMKQFEAGKGIKLPAAYMSYLENVLYLKKGAATKGASNQFFIDTANMSLSLGGEFYKLDDIANQESKIVAQLKDIYHNLNSFTLKDKFYSPFYEYTYENGKLNETEWENYQSYLLKSKTPDGKTRGVDAIPFVTNVTKPTAAVPYSFKQKYATLIDFELPPIEMPKAAPAATPAPTTSTSPMIGTFEMNGEKVNTFTGFSTGPIDFTGTIDEEGKPKVEVVANDTIKNAAGNSKLINETIIPTLKAVKNKEGNSLYDPSADDVELVTKFVAYKLAIELEKLQQPAAPAVQPTAPVSTDAKAELQKKISGLKDQIKTTYAFMGNTDSNAAVVRAKKDIELYEQELKELKEELAALEEEAKPETKEEYVNRRKSEIFKQLKDKYPTLITGDTINPMMVQSKYMSSEDIDLAQKVLDTKILELEYNAGLQGAKPDEYKPDDADLPSDDYMRVGVNENEVPMTDAELEAFKKFHAEKVPGIPFEVLDNVVTTYDNEKAFGVFENGVAKFHKLAPATAPYHELGEGIWKAFLTPEQRQLILDDERSRAGQFTDRASKKQIYYADATDQQLKERIWDDFAELRAGKVKAKSLGQRVLAFFRSIMEFFKSFVQKPSMKEQLFKAIESGKFKDVKISDRVKKEAPEYMRIPGLTETAAHEFVQDMTIRAANEIFGKDKKSLYKLQKVSGKEIFDKIEQLYIKENKRTQWSDTTWEMLKSRTKQKLRTMGVSFNEEERVNPNDANSSGASYAPEAFSVNWKKNSPFAIKFVASTLPKTLPTNQEYSTSAKAPQREISDQAKGYKLVNPARIFATLFNNLANTTDPRSMGKKLAELSKTDADFVRFFQRVGGNLATGEIDFGNFKYEDWRLYINFFQTFSLQKPDAFVQYVNGSDVYTAPANQFTLAKQIESRWYEAMKVLSKDPKSLIVYNRETKSYNVKPDAFPKNTPKDLDSQLEFLSKLGVNLGKDVYFKLSSEEQDDFADAVKDIHVYLQKTGNIGRIDGKTLGIQSQLSVLSNLLIKATNPIQDSTYPSVDGKRVQSSTQNNVPSVFENEFNSAKTLQELIQVRPELQDVFSKNSIVLMNNGLFYNSDGERKKLVKVSYIQGEKESNSSSGITTSKLTLGKRMTQELNQNLRGYYYILIPADSSTEWMMNLGNHITYEEVSAGRGWNKIYKVFNGYLEDDVALALDWEKRSKLKNIGNKAKELRFFKEILSTFDKSGDLVPSEVLKGINQMIEDGKSLDDIKEYIKSNSEEINRMIKVAVEDNIERTKEALIKNGQINIVSEGYSYPKLDSRFASKRDVSLNKFELSEEELRNVLTFARMNYMIANMEFHKILIGDPYQFKIKDGRLDETKRVKSLLSPRRVTFNDPEFNTHLNDEYNKVGDITLQPKEIGYHLHKDHLNTVTIKDVEFASNNYEKVNEADADSWLMDSAYREAKLKNGQWSDEAEDWYQWQMAYTRQNLPNYTYQDSSIAALDKERLKKPEPKFVIEKFKPVATGTKADSTNIDLVVDKFAQLPIFYKAVEGRNLAKLYEKMWKENIDYAVMISGRKVGAQDPQSFYNDKGEFNETPYSKESVIEVPWKAWGIQVENSYENPKDQTWGSQPAKISSMDMFDNGNETIPGAKAAYDKYTEATKRYHQNKYNQLLKKLGVKDLGNGFEVVDKKAIAETLDYELLRRTLPQNAIDSIQLDENNQWRIPFEASTEYEKIKSVLYSIINKSLVSPKLNGGPKAMSSVTLWEKGKRDPNSPNPELKFYTKDDLYCEVYLPYKFRNKFNRKRFPTDESILEYLNTTLGKEGKQILQGVAFRVPTDAMNKIEAYRIKGFLPEFMEGIAIVPSELTTKAGLDFDFDKLNTYLKSVYTDEKGNVRLVRYLGSEEATKEHFGKVFDARLEKQKVSKAEILEALQILDLGLDDPNDLVEKYSEVIDILLEDSEVDDRAEVLVQELEKLGDKNFQASLKEKYVEDMYNRSLENDYFQAMEEMITLPENFERLISPTDDAGLKKESEEINTLKGKDERTIKNRLLDATYMSTLRHFFITGKRWVGIAATNITSHALFQKTQVYLDSDKVNKLSKFDKAILGVANGGEVEIALPHNKVTINGKSRMSLSGTKTADGNNQYISVRLSGWATSVVDVANDPYIMDVIDSDLLIGPAMFMERMGAGKYVSKFLNQPIVKEYISYLESIGEKGLYKEQNIQHVKNRFSNVTKPGEVIGIDIAKLDDNIKVYHSNGNRMLTEEQNAEQEAILNEFLKYAKLATFSFKFSQSISYDTSKSRNAGSFSRKQTRTSIANQKNVFSSPDKVLDNSFIGNQRDLIDLAMSAMGAILKLKSDKFSIITDSVTAPYENDEFMTEDEFESVTSKADANFLDYIIQIKSKLNEELAALTLGDNSVAKQLEEAKQKYPNNKLLEDLDVITSDLEGGAETIKFRVNPKDADEIDLYTDLMRELSEIDPKLFDNIVKLSIVQGSYQGAVSIKSVIPIEEYSRRIKPIIDTLVPDEDIKAFAKVGSFQRNNWKDDLVMPPVNIIKTFKENENVLPFEDQYGNVSEKYESFLFPVIDTIGATELSRQILTLSPKYNSGDVIYDYVKVPRIIKDPKSDFMIDVVTGMSIASAAYNSRKAAGDKSLDEVFGYQKVKDGMGNPVTTDRGAYVYKLINLWGDGNLASEHYTDSRKSIYNNNTIQIDEISDADIINHFAPVVKAEKQLISAETETSAEVIPAKTEEDALNQLAVRSNLEPQEYEIATVYGKKQIVNKTHIPQRIKKGFSKFYSKISYGLAERYGKKIVIPGFEDIELMMEQDTNDIYEVSTGLFIATPSLTQKAKKAEVEELFKTRNIRDILASTYKLETPEESEFDKIMELSAQRKQEIITNFATKHKMTEEQAKDHINKALIEKDRETIISKLKECY